MTKTYNTETRETSTKVLAAITCDWCGTDIPFDRKHCTGTDYPDTEIQFQAIHQCYDIIGYGWAIDDLCLECGKKLGKLLKEQGINVREVDW